MKLLKPGSVELFNQYLQDYYYTLFLHAILLPCVYHLIMIKYVRNYWILKFVISGAESTVPWF